MRKPLPAMAAVAAALAVALATAAALSGTVHGTAGRLLATGLVLVAAGALGYGILRLVVPDGPGIIRALAPYAREERVAASRHMSLAQTALTQQAVQVTGRVARRWNVLPAIEGLLDRADVRLRPAEALFFHAAAVATATLLALFIWRARLPALACLVVTALAPLGALKAAAARRRKSFGAQLPDALRMLAGSLRSGRSLLQGVQVVASEADDPIGEELRRVLAQARLGRPIEDALEEVSLGVGNPDWHFAVTAIRIQRQIGGNLADLLSRVADTMVSRERLRGEVRPSRPKGG